MPSELRAHLRYPEQLFAAQADAYETYHATDTTAFWNGSDAWARALQLAGPIEQAGEIHFPDPERARRRRRAARAEGRAGAWRCEPAYVLARLPGDARERFVLATPFTPRGRENLVGYLAGSLDARGRTAAHAAEPAARPARRSARRRPPAASSSSSGVARRLELLNRESRDLGKSAVSRTVLGAPRVVPIGDTLVYVQPFYLTTGGDGVPRLQLVTTFANGRVGYGADLATALRRRRRAEQQRQDDGARDQRMSIATTQKTTANASRVNTLGSRNCAVNSTSIIAASARLSRSMISDATA